MYTFTKKAVKLRDHPDFDQLGPHLKTMLGGDGLNYSQWSSVVDQVTPKTFELLIALSAMNIGTDVTVDDPRSSTGNNPDVIATIDGVRWGFACKLLNTFDDTSRPKPKTVFDNIAKGVKQIDAAADVEHGLVIVNAKNAIPHNKFWPIGNPNGVAQGDPAEYGALQNIGSAVQTLRGIATELFDQMEAEVGWQEVLKIFENSKARPGAAFFLQTALGVIRNGQVLPTRLLFLEPETDEVGATVCDRLNQSLQDQ